MNKYFGIAEEDPEDSSCVLETIMPNFEAGESQGVYMGAEEDDEESMLTLKKPLLRNVSQPCLAPHPSLSSRSFYPALIQGSGICADNYLLYKDCWIHKQTIFWLVINKEFTSKSFN
ncbi:hypothetical protein BDR07DRAFT_1383565 [Suillus spraguei]|nr:hypothetical protein BDR07DRAFT_1383565 [Suillus spraguei]